LIFFVLTSVDLCADLIRTACEWTLFSSGSVDPSTGSLRLLSLCTSASSTQLGTRPALSRHKYGI